MGEPTLRLRCAGNPSQHNNYFRREPFMCARWEAAVHQCLSVSMLTCFLSVHADPELRPSSSDQRWFCGCSAAFEFLPAAVF